MVAAIGYNLQMYYYLFCIMPFAVMAYDSVLPPGMPIDVSHKKYIDVTSSGIGKN